MKKIIKKKYSEDLVMVPWDKTRAAMYSKRKGTSGICGQLYESKLISLLYFRAIHDKRIVEFKLASNVDNIGAFDDICFKTIVEGTDKPALVFIQAKHKENENQTLKNDLVTYFESYLKIRKIFEVGNDHSLLSGAFDETECLLVIYTNARDEFSNDPIVESIFTSILNDLIGTPNGTVKQPYRNEKNIEFLVKIFVKEQVISLAKRLAKLILGEGNSQMMLTDDLIMRYHVILAQYVFEVSEIKPDGQRLAYFRREFFNSNEEYLVLFKDILVRDILKKRIIKKADISRILTEFLTVKDVIILSKLIGTAITYDNCRIEIVKEYTIYIDQPLDQVYVPQSIVNEAVALAAIGMLSSGNFKVPAAFGNKDLILNGSDAKKEKRLQHLSVEINKLLVKYESSKIVTIDDSLSKGLLALNGGIAGAVGNIFVLDDDTKLMKITDNWDLLGDLAKRLYEKINEKCHNLHEYKFCFMIDKFPKLLFECSKYEEKTARDFLKKLLLYSHQANEKCMESILKKEIERSQLGCSNYYKVQTDTIFTKYHDAIQKWWQDPNPVPYLTQKPDIFQGAITNIIRDPLISSLKVTYMSKIKNYNYTFSEDAVRSLDLQILQLSNTTIINTENSALTVLKVMQYFKNSVVLDLGYIIDLPEKDRNALQTELMNTNDNKVFIYVFDQIQNSRNESNTLEIVKAVQNKKSKSSQNKTIINKTIVIYTNNVSIEILKKYFSEFDNTSIIRDEKAGLINLSQESQNTIFENTRVIFQGKLVLLNLILDEESIPSVTGVILNNIISEETIVVGKLTVDRNYEEIKHLYVKRRVIKPEDDVKVLVQTLKDIADDVVLLTANPGIGKSTLLSHLSLKTKETDPAIWIVRINLLEYSRYFRQWKEKKTTINILATLLFMCHVLIREKLGKENNIEVALEENNDVVYLKQCTGDQWVIFELKLFLHFYNKKEMIFLFDGFDEICPHYTNEVIKCLKSLRSNPRKHRMWITSRSYNEVKTILQREFGSSYEIDYFMYMETTEYLENYMNFNLRLNELNSTQLKNVEDFLKFMAGSEDIFTLEMEFLHQRALHRVYDSASQYLLRTIKQTHIHSWRHNLTEDDLYKINTANERFSWIFSKRQYTHSVDNRCGNPLYLFLAAYYFVDKIINYTSNSDLESTRWDLDFHLYEFYNWFLEAKIKIRYEEKNKMDICIPDIINSYDKDLADSVLRYTKLAAYAIFNHEKDRNLFSTKDLKDIKDWIKDFERGGEKMGIINSVADELPIFIHMTFTENYATEYICNCLKSEKDQDTVTLWIDFINHVTFSDSYSFNLRKILDFKMKHDDTLINVLKKYNDVRFNSFIKQISNSDFLRCLRYNELYLEITGIDESLESPLSHEEFYRILEFMDSLLTILTDTLNKNNMNKFLKFANETKLLPISIGYGCDWVPAHVFDLIRKYDKSKLKPTLFQNFSYLSHSIKYDELSSHDIIKLIQVGFLTHAEARPRYSCNVL